MLTTTFKGLRCYPVGQADGGRDAAYAHEALVFQVKWTEHPERVKDPVRWLCDAAAAEKQKVAVLHARGLRRYILVHNLPGTSALDRGQIDRLDREVAEVFADLPDLDVDVWWRDTIDRHLETQLGIHWSYPQVLSGTQAMSLLLATIPGEDAKRRERAVRAFLATQLADEMQLRFKQIGLETATLFDLFVDVPLVLEAPAYVRSSESWKGMAAAVQEALGSARIRAACDGHPPRRFNPQDDGGERYPAAALLLAHDAVDRIAVIGGPGQGKSTLLQYVCQVQRVRLLGKTEILQRLPAEHLAGPMRLPIRVELKDYAAWRRAQPPVVTVHDAPAASIEAFIAVLIQAASGGARFDVADLHDVLASTPAMIALDALDEVADLEDRQAVAGEIQAAGARLAEIAKDAMVVVTTRPSAHPGAPVLDRDRYLTLVLDPLPGHIADLYLAQWIRYRQLSPADGERLTNVWGSRRDEPHVRDLATTVMQLSILLHLMHSRGESVPDRRTQLYDEYIKALFDREAEKDPGVARHRDIMQELHGYVAFALHADAEAAGGTGRASVKGLKNLLREYLATRQRDSADVEALFTEVTERVFALVSRVEGTFEFEVQPLREYFAGRFLYDTAPYVRAGQTRPGLKEHRLQALLERPYWNNVARFYAGCFATGELAGLIDILTTAETEVGLHVAVAARLTAQQLLADRVFAHQLLPLRRAVRFAFDTLGGRVTGRKHAGYMTELAADAGGEALAAHVLSGLTADSSSMDADEATAARLLALCPPTAAIRARWRDAVTAVTAPQRLRLLQVAAESGLLSALTSAELSEVLPMLPTGSGRDALLLLGDAPLAPGTPLARRCLHAALDHGPGEWQQGQRSEEAFIFAQASPSRFSWTGIPTFPLFPALTDDTGAYRDLSADGMAQQLWETLTPSPDPDPLAATDALLTWLHQHIGDQWTSRILTVQAARPARGSSRQPSHTDIDIDAFSPGADPVTSRHAMSANRHRAAWWQEQRPAAATGARAAAAWVLALWFLAEPTAFLTCLPAADSVLAALPPDWQRRVAEAHRELTRVLPAERLDVRSLSLPPLTAPTALLLSSRLQQRGGPALRRIILTEMEQRRWPGPGTPRALREMAAQLIWPTGSHLQGCISEGLITAVQRLGHDLTELDTTVQELHSAPLSAAASEAVLGDPANWPRALVIAADAAVKAPGLEPLRKRANREHWFTDAE